MKYKVGDRVRVVNGKKSYMNDEMCCFLGKEVTISNEREPVYSIKEDGEKWNWQDHMFTGLVPEKICKNCKYKDLKDTDSPCCNCSENYFNQFEAKSTSKLEELKDRLMKRREEELESGKFLIGNLLTFTEVIELIEEMENEDD